jgi:hypothetical protein
MATEGGDKPFKTERKLLLRLTKDMTWKGLLMPGFEAPFKDMYPDLWPQYCSVIQRPMDLGTIKLRLKQSAEVGSYTELPGCAVHTGFVRDVKLVWTNCMKFNKVTNPEYHDFAQHKLQYFENKVRDKMNPALAGPETSPDAVENAVSKKAKLTPGAKPRLVFKVPPPAAKAEVKAEPPAAEETAPKKEIGEKKPRRAPKESSRAQRDGFQRLWDEQVDLRTEVPCVRRAIDKGGPDRGGHPYLLDRDLRDLVMADTTENKPLWVSPDGRIFFESFCRNFKSVESFLVAIAEPENRPKHIHEYQMTMHSLYAAASMGLTPKRIVEQLKVWSKTEVRADLESWIKEKTGKYGKVKLVLRENEHRVETAHRKVMRELLSDPDVRECMDKKIEVAADGSAVAGGAEVSTIELREKQWDEHAQAEEHQDDVVWDEMISSSLGKKRKQLDVEHFRIAEGQYRAIKKACKDCGGEDAGYPLIEEYDYLNDKKPLRGVTWRPPSERTGLQLKSAEYIRDYQALCMKRMFGANMRARSGLIVLPCGAGKTFVGITAACTINKKTMVLCPDGLSKNQWIHQFKTWTNYEAAKVIIAGFTSDELR